MHLDPLNHIKPTQPLNGKTNSNYSLTFIRAPMTRRVNTPTMLLGN